MLDKALRMFIYEQNLGNVQLKEEVQLASESQADRRIQKTLLALREAFFELVLTYSYDEIKVSDIIEKANVGRSTFYQHYKSKDDILANSMGTLLDDLARSIEPEDNKQALLGLLEHFWENRKFAPKVFSGTARRVVVQALAERIESKLKLRCKKESVNPQVPANLVAHQLAETQLVITIDWMLGKGSCTVAPMAKHIERTSKAICEAYLFG